MKKYFIFILFIFTDLFSDYILSEDENNRYYSSEHFRAIIGIEYTDTTFPYKLLDAAEISWQKEVIELGFQAPKNSAIKKIDIFVGNKKAYNYETNNYETIPSNYAGWATSYPSDNTPYFTMNPVLNDDQIKVTISHEFFHTIQYSYLENGYLDDTFKDKDIWWLEATAVLMEDEVYDDVNDYVGFLSPFFDKSYKSFEIYDGSHEYSMVIFAKFLREKYGIEFIKNTISQIDTVTLNNGYFEIISNILETNHNTSMQSTITEFANWISYKDEYFEEGVSYPEVTRYHISDNKSIEKGGILLLSDITPSIIQTYRIPRDYIEYSHISHLSKSYIDSLSNQWHLLGSSKDISDLTIFDNVKYVWNYKDKKWSFYSNDNTIYINNEDIDDLKTIKANSGFWILR